MTRQRRLIFEALKSVRSHPTADEVYAMVRPVMPHISLGTVYRNLELLAASGLIRRLHVGGTQRRFDGASEDHHHIRCEMCGRVDDIGVAAGLNPVSQVLDAGGYAVTGCRIEFLGVCAGCRAKE